MHRTSPHDAGEPVRHRSAVLERFAAAARGADLATFDLFDTLLRRRCGRPEAVFAILAERLRAVGDRSGAERFVSARIRAERLARRRAAEQGLSEVRLEDIYEELEGDWADAGGSRGAALPGLHELECEVEVAAIEADPSVKAVLDELVGIGIRVALVSDMYLPVRCIERMLRATDIAGYERFFLSNVCGVAKADGTIWDVLRRDMGLGPEARIVHLGDNPDADGQTARRHGIETFVLPVPARAQVQPSAAASQSAWLRELCFPPQQHRPSEDRGADAEVPDDAHNYWRAIGYGVVVPAALGLSAFIRKVGERYGTDRVYFLARDGLVFQKAFEATRREGETPSQYVWASRRCLNMAAMRSLGAADLDYLVSGRHPLAPEAYLRRIDVDLSDDDVKRTMHRHFADPRKVLRTPEERAKLRAMFRDLAGPILDRAQHERAGLLSHLEQIGLFKGGPAIVVDLGWHGTLQRSLMRLGTEVRGSVPDLLGVYLGTLADRPREVAGAPMRAFGWLFEDGKPESTVASTVGRSFEVAELLFSAPEPGIRYIALRDGLPQPVRNRLDPDEAVRLAIARTLHEAVVETSERLRPVVRWIGPDAFKEAALQGLVHLLSAPSREAISHFAPIRHAEGFGSAEYRPIVGTVPRLLPAPRSLLRSYRESFWPNAFLRQINPPLRWAVLLAVRLQEKIWRARATKGVR